VSNAREVTRELAELVGSRISDGDSDTGYLVDEILGIGGMGVAFLAHVAGEEAPRPGRPPLGTRCVLKVLLPDVVREEARVASLSFKKEVIALARLAEKRPPSPFVVRYLDAGEHPVVYRGKDTVALHLPPLHLPPLHLPWCAMELIDGRPLGTTLEERLKNAQGPLEPARAAALIEGMLRGVRAIHAVGLIHRDLKPSNVLVCGEPPHEIPKITDFGVARAVGVGDTFDVTVGTTGYCALEQLEGPRPGKKDTIGPWSDVFALGAIIYEVLARQEMFEAANAMGFVGRVLARNYEPLARRDDLGAFSETPAGRALLVRLDAVLARATSPRSPGGGSIGNDPALPIRHRDVDELLDELEPILTGMRALGRAPTSVARVADRAVRRWEWSVSEPAREPLTAAAMRTDGAALAATTAGLVFRDEGGHWIELPARRTDRSTVGVLQGGAGTFVVVRADGEVEVLPGGGGAFSFRLPFAVKHASALAGHPLGLSFLAVVAAHGESLVMRMQGRAASPFARLGAAEVRALALAEDESVIAAGLTRDSRGEEAFVSAIDRHGRAVALPPLPGRSIDAVAFDSDGRLLLAGPDAVGAIDRNGRLVTDERPPVPIDALAALPDGQVWGFSPGVALRRSEGSAWQIVHAERSLRDKKVLAVAASGARVWAVHEGGRVLVGRLAIGTPS